MRNQWPPGTSRSVSGGLSVGPWYPRRPQGNRRPTVGRKTDSAAKRRPQTGRAPRSQEAAAAEQRRPVGRRGGRRGKACIWPGVSFQRVRGTHTAPQENQTRGNNPVTTHEGPGRTWPQRRHRNEWPQARGETPSATNHQEGAKENHGGRVIVVRKHRRPELARLRRKGSPGPWWWERRPVRPVGTRLEAPPSTKDTTTLGPRGCPPGVLPTGGEISIWKRHPHPVLTAALATHAGHTPRSVSGRASGYRGRGLYRRRSAPPHRRKPRLRAPQGPEDAG